jgi:signal transduction histidine kinase
MHAAVFGMTVVLGLYATRRYLREDRRLPVLAFAVLMFSLSFWELMSFVIEMVVSREFKLIAYNITNAIAIPVYLFSLLFFALAFAERQRWIKWAVTVSAAVLVGLSALLLVRPEFLYESRGLVTRGPVTVLGVTFEEFVLHDRKLNLSFRLYALYAYAVTLASGGIILRYVLTKADELRTEQSALIAIGIGTPMVVNVLVFLRVLPPSPNITDVGFGVTAAAFAVAIFRYQLFELPPVSRHQLIRGFDDPFVFVDDDDEVVYTNPTARQVFDVETDWRGMDATEFFGPHAGAIQPFYPDESTEDGTLEIEGSDRYFDVKRTSVRTPDGNVSGHIVALRDVTKLERTNRRLDQFTSTVSHELRTPLNEAMVRTDRLAREYPDERTESVEAALDRMESVIDNMLTLAHSQADIEETETCSLEPLLKGVWASVRTDGAELECHVGDAAVDADPVRLFQVLENLLRNAIVHNDSPLTVRVGLIDGDPDSGECAGFYVEDDGKGIPEPERDEVFDHGYTRGRGGNGYGLSIVRHIVDAHGWTIGVTDGADGGARFEITGVDAGPVRRR